MNSTNAVLTLTLLFSRENILADLKNSS